MRSVLLQGDCLEVLKEIPDNSVDSLITDPPAGISFMGKEWDKSDGFIPFMTDVMKEALRILKPGAHGLVWAIPRTSHWTATALENAGFEIRDVITHLFGSGFPKSLDISKAIDKAAGAKREIVGYRDPKGSVHGDAKPDSTGSHIYSGELTSPKGVTDAAKRYQGWGTALKPASEHWILVRKPLSEKTVAANTLKHGTGGINIDGCRIDVNSNDPNHRKSTGGYVKTESEATTPNAPYNKTRNATLTQGRFPANLVLSHNEDCEDTCTAGCVVAILDKQSGNLHAPGSSGGGKTFGSKTDQSAVKSKTPSFKDSGGASRFFYCAKAPKSDKNAGCEGLEEKTRNTSSGNNRTRYCTGCNLTDSGSTNHSNCNGEIVNSIAKPSLNHHPTVKNTKLMSYLIKLITPRGGIVLDPFMGSGSTGVSAIKDGFEFIGIERESEYFAIAEKRIEHAEKQSEIEEEVA